MKPVTSISVFLIILLCSVCSYGQGENNIWCFGIYNDGGLNFNAGPPVIYLSKIHSWEASASVSDASGNLLFYHDAMRAFNRNHIVMPNGSGLLGNASSTQGAAIVQSFSNPDRYYLFTLQCDTQVHSYLYYSVVDMTLNGGLGDVVTGQKNILIDSNVSEKMTVVKGGGCFDWVIVHARSAAIFHAFKVDAGGVNTNPVISNSGFTNVPSGYEVGEIKMSPNDSNIVLVNNWMNQSYPVELHSFNSATGVVGNAISLDTVSGYGVNYSPDGSKLYIAGGSVLQYDMSLMPDVQAVNNSKTTLFFGYSFWTMRMGPDHKLYTRNGGNLSVINYPNLAGAACDFVFGWMNTNTGGLGLGMNFVSNPPPGTTTYYSHDTSGCFYFNSFTLTAPAGYDVYAWSDGTMMQTDTLSSSGTKWVTSAIQCNIRVDTFHVIANHIDTVISVSDTTVCFVAGSVTLSAAAGYTGYLWSDNTTLQTYTFTGPGTKWVTAQSGCNVLIDTFHVAAGLDTTKVIIDTSICFANSIPVLSAPAGYITYLWSDGITTQQDTISIAGTKWVRAQNGCNLVIDTFKVKSFMDTTITVSDTSHCVAYSPITIIAPGGYTSYLWSDGKTTQTDTFFSTTTKWVYAKNGCDVLIDTVHFTATTVPSDSVTMAGLDTAICFEAGLINVSAPGGYTYYLWSDGTPTQTNVFTGPAIKWVYAQKVCYLLIDTFTVSSQQPDTATSRRDTFICFAQQAIISADTGYITYLWSDGNAGRTNTFADEIPTKYVSMHKPCQQAIDTFYLHFVNGLSVGLGVDTSVCHGETVQLNASTSYPGAVYLWQDNSSVAIYNATEGGDYSVKVSVGPCAVYDTVRVHQEIIDVKLKDKLIPCDEEFVLLDAGVDNSSYLWQDGSTNRTIKATKEGLYTVKVTQDLCTATAKANVKYEGCPCAVVIPTGFSPNNDGKNDKFGATISCALSSYKMMVYGRWGNRVFYSEHVNDKWDGTVKGVPVDGDVYYYYLEFKDGENKVYYHKGDVTVVR